MPEREKVINEMQRYVENPNLAGVENYGAKIVDMPASLIADAIALLKAQEPRVLSYDEARNHAMQVMNPDSIKPLFIEFREKYDDEEEERPPWRGGYNQRLLLARSMDYNVHFRFWTDRPTMEQMEATPWG